MHSEIIRRLAEQRRAELAQEMSLIRKAGLARAVNHQRASGLAAGHARRRLGWLRVLRPGGPSVCARARQGVTPAAVFLAEPEAFGVRAYLTAAEARQLAADWAEKLACYADRLDEPGRRPAGAQPFELVILGSQVPALAEASAAHRRGASG